MRVARPPRGADRSAARPLGAPQRGTARLLLLGRIADAAPRPRGRSLAGSGSPRPPPANDGRSRALSGHVCNDLSDQDARRAGSQPWGLRKAAAISLPLRSGLIAIARVGGGSRHVALLLIAHCDSGAVRCTS